MLDARSIDVAVQAKLGLLEEEIAAVRSELTVGGLNFRLLRRKQRILAGS